MKKLIISLILIISLYSHGDTESNCRILAQSFFKGKPDSNYINAEIACTGQSNPDTIHECLTNALEVLDRDIDAAYACSHNTDYQSIKYCLKSAMSAFRNSSTKKYNASIACSGSNLDRALRVQQCIYSYWNLNETSTALSCGKTRL